jgi:ribosomal protein L15E
MVEKTDKGKIICRHRSLSIVNLFSHRINDRDYPGVYKSKPGIVSVIFEVRKTWKYKGKVCPFSYFVR